MNFLLETDPRWKVWKACESPIEQMLCCGLFALLGCKAVHDPYNLNRRPELAEIAGSNCAAFAFSQHWIKPSNEQKYRADFLLVLINPIQRTARHIVLECDGREFHETEEQQLYDRQRDEDILASGYYAVRRFSGRDINYRFQNTITTIMADLVNFNVEPDIPEDCAAYAAMICPTAFVERIPADDADLYDPPIYGQREAPDEYAFI
jgi:hypothetical protein